MSISRKKGVVSQSIRHYTPIEIHTKFAVRAKGLFLQPQLLRNIDLIIELLIIFFSDNATVFNKIYTQHLNGYKKATYKISFFPDECFVRK